MSAPRIFLDTAEIDEIREAVSTGMVDGIATNPNKIAQAGKSYAQTLDEIRAVFEGPIAFQSMGRSTEEIIRHARQIHAMDPQLCVKVVANRIGIPAIKPLVAEGVRTNATLIFNPGQALMAGLAGSPYISPFIGRARMVGADGVEAIARMRNLYDSWGLDKTCIIGASIKDVEQALDVIEAGAHALAVPFAVFMGLMDHPLTDKGMESFLQEFESLNEHGGEES